MDDWNETGYSEIDFLPREDNNSEHQRTEINCAPHTKKQCDPEYVCEYHGNPEEGT